MKRLNQSMHPRRKEGLFMFGVVGVVVLALTFLTVRAPNFFFVSLLGLFLILALLLGYRVFAYSDDGYRAKERRETDWQARHPRLMFWITVAVAIGLIFQVVHSFAQ
jgi:amino acid transporter